MFCYFCSFSFYINLLGIARKEGTKGCIIFSNKTLDQGWPTSQMPRAAFLVVVSAKSHVIHARDNDRNTIPPIDRQLDMLCLAGLVVYRLVSSVCDDIGADGLGFVAWAIWVKVNKVSPPLRCFFKFEAVLPKVL